MVQYVVCGMSVVVIGRCVLVGRGVEGMDVLEGGLTFHLIAFVSTTQACVHLPQSTNQACECAVPHKQTCL